MVRVNISEWHSLSDEGRDDPLRELANEVRIPALWSHGAQATRTHSPVCMALLRRAGEWGCGGHVNFQREKRKQPLVRFWPWPCGVGDGGSLGKQTFYRKMGAVVWNENWRVKTATDMDLELGIRMWMEVDFLLWIHFTPFLSKRTTLYRFIKI